MIDRKILIKDLKRYQKSCGDITGLKKRDIADMTSVSYEVFRKYINKEKPTERRDCIIAVCAVMGATAAETNDGMDELAKGWKRPAITLRAEYPLTGRPLCRQVF